MRVKQLNKGFKMNFKLIKSDEPTLTDDYYKLKNNLGLDINIQVFKDNGTITYVVYEWFEKEGMMQEIDGFRELSKAKKCARDYGNWRSTNTLDAWFKEKRLKHTKKEAN